ncbi:hypothetical protein MLD38_019877 [Melastoma candidum]|uniref:Uncharacterized protein n=1 Tax=Melastoma candidum TaxID=119954 RepID=A0ACB9QBL0_9MYRT|nr:hypothetical protein MLD38_019877 [Melastoma candidum]
MIPDVELALCLGILPALVVARLLYKTSALRILLKFLQSLEERCYLCQSYKVPQFDENSRENQLYRKVSTYLESLPSLDDSDFTDLVSGARPNDVVLHLSRSQVVRDKFMGARLSWTNERAEEGLEGRAFVLKIRGKDRKRILQPYLQHIFQVSDEIQEKRKEARLFVNLGRGGSAADGSRQWGSVPLSHPATMDTVLMDVDQKNKVKADLEQFLKSKQYYQRLGRVWRRSYLLHGAPGTGKSTFAVAMAKFLGFDVYDLNLSGVRNDSDLKALLIQTTSRSVIVVEDLDRFFSTASGTSASVSGVLDFMDGIVSCCREEQIMIFTMTSREGVDAAAIRPGRIDVQINFPLCDLAMVKALAGTYLGVKEHKLFPQVEEAIQAGPGMSPAHVGELLLANKGSPSRALKAVIGAVQQAQVEARGKGEGAKAGEKLTGSRSGRSTDELGDSGSLFCRESVHTVREFRKLYGLFKLGSRRRDDSMDLGSIDLKEALTDKNDGPK